MVLSCNNTFLMHAIVLFTAPAPELVKLSLCAGGLVVDC